MNTRTQQFINNKVEEFQGEWKTTQYFHIRVRKQNLNSIMYFFLTILYTFPNARKPAFYFASSNLTATRIQHNFKIETIHNFLVIYCFVATPHTFLHFIEEIINYWKKLPFIYIYINFESTWWSYPFHEK